MSELPLIEMRLVGKPPIATFAQILLTLERLAMSLGIGMPLLTCSRGFDANGPRYTATQQDVRTLGATRRVIDL